MPSVLPPGNPRECALVSWGPTKQCFAFLSAPHWRHIYLFVCLFIYLFKCQESNSTPCACQASTEPLSYIWGPKIQTFLRFFLFCFVSIALRRYANILSNVPSCKVAMMCLVKKMCALDKLSFTWGSRDITVYFPNDSVFAKSVFSLTL